MAEKVRTRICPSCSLEITFREPDPCLGYIDGVAHACCGHGDANDAYACGWPDCLPNQSWMIQSEAGNDLRPGSWRLEGWEALDFFKTKSLRREKNG